MGDARQPQQFNFEATDLKKEWADWLQAFGFFLIASKKSNEKDEVKIAILLNQLGSRGIEIYNTLKADREADLDDEDTKNVLAKYQEVIEAFTDHFSPKRNVLYERFKFNKLALQGGQPLLDFITQLKTAATTCDFEERDNMIRDRIISQITEEDLLNRLLDKGDELNLEETMKICKLHGSRKTELKDFAAGSSEPKEVDAIRNTSRRKAIHKEELAEKDRKQRVKLDVQISQITSEWEDRLRRELAKLKGNLENTHREEKIVAVDMAKHLKEQEIAALKQSWEKKSKEFKDEIANYKRKLDAMENSHKEEIENAQTSSDRDTLDLRRKMDKLDMEYQSRIEKMQEQHEAELSELRQECERKIMQIDSTYQLQAGTTRTTIELVKQQMMNENQMRIDRLQAMHRQQMEEQWEKLDSERRNEVRGLEDAHRAALEQLRKELDEIRKAVTPSGSKQSNRQRTPIPESAKQMVIDQLNHEATNPYSCGDLDGIDAVSAGSDAEKILFAKLQQLTRQANEDKAEIERLRLRLEEKECVKMTQPAPQQQQQPQQQRGQQHPPHPTRRNRKRRN